MTSELNTAFLNAARRETVYCTARVLKLGKRIIYGTAWKKADTSRLVTLAIEQGFRAIDTACQPKHYNEVGVGEGIAAALGAGLNRGDLFIQTKFTPVSGQDPANLPYDRDAALAVQVAQSFEASERHLQTDYVDSLILHSPLAHASQTLEAWRAMEALVAYEWPGNVRQLENTLKRLLVTSSEPEISVAELEAALGTAQAVEPALAAGQALHDDLGVFGDEIRHVGGAFRGAGLFFTSDTRHLADTAIECAIWVEAHIVE